MLLQVSTIVMYTGACWYRHSSCLSVHVDVLDLQRGNEPTRQILAWHTGLTD